MENNSDFCLPENLLYEKFKSQKTYDSGKMNLNSGAQYATYRQIFLVLTI